MNTLTAHTQESVFDLRTSSVVEKAIDAIELTDKELESVNGAWFGWDGFGGCGGWGGFGGWGCGFFIPVITLIPVFPSCGWGGFGGWGW